MCEDLRDTYSKKSREPLLPCVDANSSVKKRTKSSSSLLGDDWQVDNTGSLQDPPGNESIGIGIESKRRLSLVNLVRTLVALSLIFGGLLVGFRVAPRVSSLALGCAELYRALVAWHGLPGGVYMAFLGDHALMEGWMEDGLTGYHTNATHGRGILIPAGGQNQLLNAFSNLYVLRNHLKCSLPVTVAYWGGIEKEKIDQGTQKLFEKYISGVSFLDLSTVEYPKHQRLLHIQNTAPSKFYGFKVKVFALYAAPYEQVLLMDSDSMALQNPEDLFESDAFVQHGNMFWPDRWCTPVKIFEKLSGILGEDEHDGQIHALELAGFKQQTDSGQLLFDRQRHSDVLEWLLFLNTHEEFTYRYAYGDKDTYKAAFLLSKKEKEYFQVGQRLSIGLHSFMFFKNNPQGFIQHHPQDNSLLFIHRTSKAKYAMFDEENASRNFEYILMQPTCEWNRKYWHFFRPMLFFNNHVTSGVDDINQGRDPSSSTNTSLVVPVSLEKDSRLPSLVGEKSIPKKVHQCQEYADQAAQMYRSLLFLDNMGSDRNMGNSIEKPDPPVWHVYAAVTTIAVLALYILRVVCF